MTDTTAPSPGRRNLLLAGAGAAAALAGAGWAWWDHRLAPADEAAAAALWDLNFDTPTGGSLAMAGFRGHPLLLNFWATWCPPCVEEMPLLDAFFREQQAKGLQLVGLAIDQPSAVRQFLGRTPVHYPIGLAGLGGTDLGRSLGNESGGLPFSVLLAADGSVRERRMGRLSRDDLARWAAAG